jgi:hypothetical protein
MKKILITILALVSFTASLGQDFQFGLHFSPHLAFLKSDTKGVESNSKLGFSAGLMGEFALAENYLVATGIDVILTGAKYNFTPLGGGALVVADVNNLQYVQLPVKLKMKTNEIGYITYFGEAGLSLALRTKSRGEITTLNTAYELDFNPYVSPFRAAMVIGAGGQYSLGGRTAALASLSFNNSFTQVLNGDLIPLQIGVSHVPPVVKHAFVSLKLGVLF